MKFLVVHLKSNNFRIIRFEDLCSDPKKVVKEIVNFYGLAFDDEISKFLETHTNGKMSKSLRTRNSTAVSSQWLKELSFNEVQEIQEKCEEAMKLWGYKKVCNSSVFSENFDPVLPFNDFE